MESESSRKIRDVHTSPGKHIITDLVAQKEPPGFCMFALSGREELLLLKKARILFAPEMTLCGDKGGSTV